MQLTVSKVMIG